MNEQNSFFDNEVSPLDALKERIKNIQSGEASEEKQSTVQGFTIDIEDSKPAEAEAIHEEKEETSEPMAIEEQQPDASDLVEEEPQKSSSTHHSFLNRMSRFTTNDKGENALEEIEKPSYELETVDEILGVDNDSSDEDSHAYDYLSELDYEPEEDGESEEDLSSGSEEFKGFISDIDVPKRNNVEPENKPPVSDTATIRFTPVNDVQGEKPVLKVETITNQFDLRDEFTEQTSAEDNTIADIEEEEFDDYKPENEILDKKDEKQFLHKLAVKKRNYFLGSFVSGLLLFVLVIFLMPSIYENFYNGSQTLLTVSTVILGVMVLLNYEMFKSIISAIKGRLQFDLCAATASLSTLALSIYWCVKKINEDTCFTVITVCAFMLFFRLISRFYSVSNMHGNLKVISVPRPKKALSLINDDATTLAMAKNSIQGKVMVATSRKTDRVADYVKYSTYKTSTFEKSSILIAVSISLALVAAVIAGMIKGSLSEALYVSSAILCAAAMPIVFLIEVLPLRSAATRLNRIGAMLNGYAGAEKVNQANAAVIKTEDIFPHGSVVLKDLKVLSNNNVDDIILRAASLTDAVSSPLSNIFKQIAKTNAAYDVPPSDTVKYEKRLGISGWVNDELMFIGNRTLLQAHGIDVPDLEYDREILKKGFFPVYVATDNKACILLVIKYSADPAIAKQLRNAADLGITLLVENSDPNVTDEMICDYFDLYEDSVVVMNGAGVSAHHAATQPIDNCSAPAAYRGNSMSLLQIMCSAARVKKSNTLLTVIYVIAAIIGIVYFIYNSFLGDVSVAERGLTVLVYELAATAVSLVAFMIKKP